MNKERIVAGGLLIVALAGLVYGFYSMATYPASKEHGDYLEQGMNGCRNWCVAHAAEGFQYSFRNGCTCTGQLP